MHKFFVFYLNTYIIRLACRVLCCVVSDMRQGTGRLFVSWQAAPSSDCSADESGSITTNRANIYDHRASFKSNLSDTDVMFLNVSPSAICSVRFTSFTAIKLANQLIHFYSKLKLRLFTLLYLVHACLSLSLLKTFCRTSSVYSLTPNILKFLT